jgi:hypothetical protein
MLTCKSVAMLVCNPVRGLTNEQELTSGEEQYVLDFFLDGGFIGDYDTEEEAEQAMEDLELKFDSRVEYEHVAKFYQRLDSGWNQSASKFCYSCGLFKSYEQKYWDKKVKKWLYKDTSSMAKRFRTIEDCWCGCKGKCFIDEWIAYGKHGVMKREPGIRGRSHECAPCEYVQCPECKLERSGPCKCECECCYEHMGCGCGDQCHWY